MISVLIPVYNDDLRNLLKQIYHQAFQAKIQFEILVADDASTQEDTKRKNQLYGQLKHCKFYNFSENQGRTFMRNFLAQKASYDHLLFLDSDVLPKNQNFIQEFIAHINQADLIFGGINYAEETPPLSQILRWKYGKAREAKSVEQRKKNPYFTIISQALFIKKQVFLEANQYLQNQYGLDSVFTSNLLKNQAKILHINNPIIHYGLESSEKFIKKTEKGLETLAELEQKNLIDKNYRPVQTAYRKLESLRLLRFYNFGYRLFRKKILKNLYSNNPSLFYFDLYKLNFYIDCKNQKK